MQTYTHQQMLDASITRVPAGKHRGKRTRDLRLDDLRAALAHVQRRHPGRYPEWERAAEIWLDHVPRFEERMVEEILSGKRKLPGGGDY